MNGNTATQLDNKKRVQKGHCNNFFAAAWKHMFVFHIFCDLLKYKTKQNEKYATDMRYCHDSLSKSLFGNNKF